MSKVSPTPRPGESDEPSAAAAGASPVELERDRAELAAKQAESGLTPGAGASLVRIARGLKDLPHLKAAFSCGALSLSQVKDRRHQRDYRPSALMRLERDRARGQRRPAAFGRAQAKDLQGRARKGPLRRATRPAASRAVAPRPGSTTVIARQQETHTYRLMILA